ncbi:ComF family protein [Ornithinibacillus sp. 179-J 7C1 HS]|uniref:ComF family protein n=1 Tax=Ornithinibacillus sp. 179-J 7C1 HS TaxID=3142384 RepID=UPI00399FA711
MKCLWCNEEILFEVNWTNLFYPNKVELLCDKCRDNLVELSGERCRKCSRVTDETICSDCKWWEKYHNGADLLEFNYSIYHYSPFMQDFIAKWKYRGDYELGNIFKKKVSEHFHHVFGQLKDAVLVPIPLSPERLQERCFNQAEMLATFIPLPQAHILSRIHGEKQSKKSRKERISSENPFILHEKLNNSVILVDDIYTTGTTLRHAAKLLKDAGCSSVYTYTLIRG